MNIPALQNAQKLVLAYLHNRPNLETDNIAQLVWKMSFPAVAKSHEQIAERLEQTNLILVYAGLTSTGQFEVEINDGLIYNWHVSYCDGLTSIIMGSIGE